MGTRISRMWLPAVLSLVLLALSACGEDRAPAASKPAPADADRASCDVGQPAKYLKHLSFPESPSIVGCARLAGGNVVELSAYEDRLGRSLIVCINRRYSVVYVPAICPSPEDLTGTDVEVLTAEQPRQGRQTRRLGFEYVVSGTVSTEAESVSVRYTLDGAARARAVVVRVDRRLASTLGVRDDFAYFITELPAAAACHRIVVSAESSDHLIGTDSFPGRANVCDRAE